MYITMGSKKKTRQCIELRRLNTSDQAEYRIEEMENDKAKYRTEDEKRTRQSIQLRNDQAEYRIEEIEYDQAELRRWKMTRQVSN